MLSLVLAALLAAEPGAAPAPPPAALDTVYLANGGRARGSVVEDSPTAGVTLQLPDGSFRKFPRAEVVRVEYAGEQAAPPAYPPPPMAAPPAEPQPAALPPQNTPASVTFALGLSGAWISGSVSENYGSASDWFGGFGQIDLEGGVRVTPATTLLLQIDFGAGAPTGGLKQFCDSFSFDCTTGVARIGVAARYAFTPVAASTPWVSAGLGTVGTSVVVKGPGGTETLSFGGWEWLKLGAGWDLRLNRTFGLGAFMGFSFGTFGSVSASGPANFPPPDLGGSRTHTWFTLGARAVLFP